MCAKTSGETTWPASSRRLRSFQAGSMLWKTPGVSPRPYQSPFVVSAPSRECRLWSISECFGLKSSSSRSTGEPEYASQRHMRCSDPQDLLLLRLELLGREDPLVPEL